MVPKLKPKPRMNFSTQAKQCVSQEQCSSAAFTSDYITSQGAGVHLPSSRAQQPSLAALSAASVAEQQSSIPVECVLHNTITNTLTAVRTVKNVHCGKLIEIPKDFHTDSWISIALHHLDQL